MLWHDTASYSTNARSKADPDADTTTSYAAQTHPIPVQFI
jgi:hypothetical protein